MRHVFQTWKFRHMSSADFERTFQEGAGQDLRWFFDQALHTARALDYGVGSVSTTEVSEDRGYFWHDGKRTLEGKDEKQDEKEPEKKDEAAGDAKDGKKGDAKPAPDSGAKDKGKDEKKDYRSTVVIERWGEFIHPVTVEMRFADDHVERREWDGAERWVRYEIVRPAKLVSAEVDPDHVMALDFNRLNNSRLVEPRPAAAYKLVVHILYWLQNLFAATALVG
jgi:hypothetical protein